VGDPARFLATVIARTVALGKHAGSTDLRLSIAATDEIGRWDAERTKTLAELMMGHERDWQTDDAGPASAQLSSIIAMVQDRLDDGSASATDIRTALLAVARLGRLRSLTDRDTAQKALTVALLGGADGTSMLAPWELSSAEAADDD
jgi:hypothetical protein